MANSGTIIGISEVSCGHDGLQGSRDVFLWVIRSDRISFDLAVVSSLHGPIVGHWNSTPCQKNPSFQRRGNSKSREQHEHVSCVEQRNIAVTNKIHAADVGDET